jgi:hypothetical protein
MNCASQKSAKGQRSIASFFSSGKHVEEGQPRKTTTKDTSAHESTANETKILIKGAKRAFESDVDCAEEDAASLKRSCIASGRAESDQKRNEGALEQVEDDISAERARGGCVIVTRPTIKRDPARHDLARRKFAVKKEILVLGNDNSNVIQKGIKYTPLEQQVIDLKKRNADKILLVEVRISKLRFCRHCQVQICTPFYRSLAKC